jgi:thiol-disulfide isomerase/thioredoxin
MRRPVVYSLIGLCAFALAGPAFAADAPPQVTEQLAAAAVPAHPYDENADAKAAVALALTRAVTDRKFVLIDFGGNWCPDCRVTAGVLAMKQVHPWIEKNFIVVPVDVGRMNKNLDIAQTYNLKIQAVPTIVILDGKGRMLNAGNPDALKDARGMTPQAVVDTLNGWIQNPG